MILVEDFVFFLIEMASCLKLHRNNWLQSSGEMPTFMSLQQGGEQDSQCGRETLGDNPLCPQWSTSLNDTKNDLEDQRCSDG